MTHRPSFHVRIDVMDRSGSEEVFIVQIGLGDSRVVTADDAADDINAEIPVQLDYAVQEVIGSALKDYCNDIIKAPVPDKFLSLLAKLEAEERKKGQSK